MTDQRLTDQQPPHTPRSLIVTFYGAYGRGSAEAPAGPVPIASLIRLLGTVGVDSPSVRSAVSRLKRRGLLVAGRTADGAAGYGLSSAARELLADGDRRIYGRPAARSAQGWLLAVFSVPEQERHKRHLLRSRLSRLGFGTAAPGVWIAPRARTRGDPAHAGTAGSGPLRRSVPRLPPGVRAHRRFGGPLVGPGGAGHAAPGVPGRPRARTAPLGAAASGAAGGRLPRLPAGAGLLAAAAVRGPGAAGLAASRRVAGRAGGPGLRGAARAAAGRGGAQFVGAAPA
ncbi:hypothetical protein GCM10020000_18720 [Streptomyces olivoverticillatus]